MAGLSYKNLYVRDFIYLVRVQSKYDAEADDGDDDEDAVAVVVLVVVAETMRKHERQLQFHT